MIFINSLPLGLSFMIILIFCLSNIRGVGFSHAASDENMTSTIVRIDDMNITALVALTSPEQSTGLAIKNTLAENEGMLFVFDTPSKYSFWMKDMKFPIDIIWLDSNKKIVHVEDSLEPCLFLLPCPSYSPTVDSKYVLEVVSNFTNKHDINI